MRFLTTLLLLVLTCSAAWAEDYASLGDAIVAAAKAGDAEALARHGRETGLDIWIAADEVVSRGGFDAALAWARAAAGEESAALVAYIERTRKVGYDQTTREAVRAARRDRVHAKAKEVRERLLGIDEKPDTIEGIRLLIQRSNARIAYDRAEAVHADRDKGIAASLAIGWRSGAAETCRIGAVKANRRLEHERTESLLRRRVRIEATRKSPRSHVDALLRLHRHLDRRGQDTDARKVLATARTTAEASGLARARIRARIAGARQTWIDSDPEAARTQLDAALALARTPEDRGFAHDEVGLLYEEFSLWDEALGHWTEAAKTAKGDALGSTLFDLGWEYDRRGQYGQSLRSFEQLLDVTRKAGDRWYEQTALYYLSGVYYSLDKEKEASAYADQAFELAEALLDTGRVARSCRQRATRRANAGDLEGAFALQEKEIALRTQGGHRLSLGYALRNLGHLMRRAKRHEEARSLYERALAIARSANSRNLTADCKSALARLLIEQENLDGAEVHAREALAIYEELDQPVMTVGVMEKLLLIFRLQKRHAEAMHLGLRAIGLIAKFLHGLPDEDRARLSESYTGVFGNTVYAAWRSQDHASMLYGIQRARALGLMELLGGRDQLSRAALPPELERARTTALKRESVAYQGYQRAKRTGHLRRTRTQKRMWEAARSARIAVAERIEREAKLLADVLDPAVDDLATIHARVREGEALVSYVFSGWEFAALILEHGKPPRIVELPSKKTMAEPFLAMPWSNVDRDGSKHIAKLRTHLIERLELGKDVRRLLISHEEELLEIPFCALAPEYEIVYIPSGTTYGLLRREAGKRGRGVLAVGDPKHPGRRDRLASAALEARTVGTDVLVGEAATEDAVRTVLARAKRWRALHFACHGTYDERSALESALLLARGKQQDGLLTAREIVGLRMRADLVTLSACETGRGKAYEAEGLFGLVRGVLLAGAPRVIVSLWKVDDEATKALMTEFYRLWNPTNRKGLSTAAALRAAQAHVRAQPKWKHPYYWSAWALWGLPD